MTTKWRPEGWRNPYGTPAMGKKASSWFEFGADAMLEVLRKDDGNVGKYVFIPDDPVSIPKKPDNSKGQLMICSKPHCESACCGCIAGEPHEERFCYKNFFECPVCVPYEPEKEKTDSCKSIFNNIIVTLGMTTADFIEPHPVSQVIEKGYFCPKCGMKVQSDIRCRTFKGINY
jgi:hypothetical protein